MKARSPRHAPYFFVDPDSLPVGAPGDDSAPIALEGADARHLAVVRRAAPGDAVRVSDGGGRVVEAALVSVSAARVEARIVSETRVPPPHPVVEVEQGLSRGDKVDTVLRQLVELGVDAVGVFEGGRSVARWDASRQAAAAARWRTIAREAAKQSHRAWLPVVRGPASLEATLAQVRAEGPGLGLVAHPGASQRLGEALARHAAAPPRRVWLAVGPEGGLSDEEVEAFRAAGAVPVSLGEQILRTETAPIVVAALVLHRFGRLG
jgi:16S rRNA (uracil1498-N3)-methyltransferase